MDLAQGTVWQYALASFLAAERLLSARGMCFGAEVAMNRVEILRCACGGVVIANVEVLRSKSAEPRKWPDRNRVWLVSATTSTGISRDQNTEKKHLKRRDETSLRESSIGTP